MDWVWRTCLVAKAYHRTSWNVTNKGLVVSINDLYVELTSKLALLVTVVVS